MWVKISQTQLKFSQTRLFKKTIPILSKLQMPIIMNRSILRSTFALLNTDHVKLNKNWNYKNVTSTFYRLYFIDGGEGKLFNTTEVLGLEEGYLYLVPSFTTCNHYCDSY